ncbi:hypothetical protein CDAR_164501 [Caerostris darwini]|uniref:Uncharacterized protein n=1 Tax=Caerostris darwini TaxID=1538125 RepID=A0AAV4QQV3_9ARAC|nr:hypothetical protein CDAR_164501 [Caerostris darwini]
MNRSMMIALLVGLVLCAVVIEQAEAGGGLRWARLAKLALIAKALKGKKIFLPLPLPLPIPLFKEKHPPPACTFDDYEVMLSINGDILHRLLDQVSPNFPAFGPYCLLHVHHHTKAVIGYGLEQPHYGGHHGGYY